jgi:small subunit ribosomal protein S9
MTDPVYFYGTGKRKSAIARVRLIPGGGQVVINGKPLAEMFPQLTLQEMLLEPLKISETLDRFNVMAKVAGGGATGQAGAIRHGISRALVVADERLRPLLRQHRLLTRDSRVKERKKYGLKRARKAAQYTKR